MPPFSPQSPVCSANRPGAASWKTAARYIDSGSEAGREPTGGVVWSVKGYDPDAIFANVRSTVGRRNIVERSPTPPNPWMFIFGRNDQAPLVKPRVCGEVGYRVRFACCSIQHSNQ